MVIYFIYLGSNHNIEGKTGFLAPEVLRYKEYKKPSDVFSLGVVFYYIFTK